jgi:DJ-1/PfpI family
MRQQLQGKRVAILATDGFEQAELLTPRDELKKAGATVDIVSPNSGQIQGFDHLTPDKTVAVDKTLGQASAGDYDALVLPGGANNPDSIGHRIDGVWGVEMRGEDQRSDGLFSHLRPDSRVPRPPTAHHPPADR